MRDWKSRWFGERGQYSEFLRCDVMIREYLIKRLRGLYVAGVEIERGAKSFRIIIKSSRPGMIIGRSGEGQVKLRKDIMRVITKHKLTVPADFKLDIEEVRSPESSAPIVAQMIAEGLEKRLPFRRVIKQMVDKVMANRDVKGVKVILSGRLGGAEMARVEKLKKGSVPLQTMRADIDFAREKAHLTYGDIGIKTWIYRGEVFAEKGKN